LKLVGQLRALRTDATAICQRSIEAIAAGHAAQTELFRLVANYCKAEEVVRLHGIEAEKVAEYQRHLNTVVDFMKVEKIAGWCTELGDVAASLRDAIADQMELEAQFAGLLSDGIGPEEIGKMTDDVEELLATNARLIEDEATLDCQLTDAQEDPFQLLQKMGDDDDDEELEAMLICPLCVANERDAMIITSGHVMCMGCAQGHGARCPICERPFERDDVKPFFFQ
jgi:hypothetical protein